MKKFKYVSSSNQKNQISNYSNTLIKSEYDRYYNNDLIKDYKTLLDNNCYYLPNFICKKEDQTIFNDLINELNQHTTILNWSKHKKFENPEFSPTFNIIIQQMKNHFNVDIFQTRLNYYENENDWKPFHKDSHAYGKNMLKENFTMGASFGDSRELVFKHESSNNTFSFPQHNGDVFSFTSEVNDKFLHSIPKSFHKKGPRISIIAWGRREL